MCHPTEHVTPLADVPPPHWTCHPPPPMNKPTPSPWCATPLNTPPALMHPVHRSSEVLGLCRQISSSDVQGALLLRNLTMGTTHSLPVFWTRNRNNLERWGVHSVSFCVFEGCWKQRTFSLPKVLLSFLITAYNAGSPFRCHHQQTSCSLGLMVTT